MTDIVDKPQVTGKTVQEYIDERPSWPDGTMLPSTPMTAMQFRIWALACAGVSQAAGGVPRITTREQDSSLFAVG